MEFSRQEYWSGLPFPSPRDLSNPGIEPGSPALQADALPSEPPGKPLCAGQLLLLLLSHFSRVRLCATLWAVAYQTPLAMGFSRQEYWSGLPCAPPEDLLNPEIEPVSLTSPTLAGRFFTTRNTFLVP